MVANNDKYKNQIGTYGYKDIEYKGRDFEFIAINSNKFDKIQRQAINLAIDKEQISQSLGSGNVYSGFPTDFGHFSYNFNIKLEYNTKKAKDILLKNGYELKDGKWFNKSKKSKFVIDIVVNERNRKQLKIAKDVSSNLNKFGIECRVIEKASNEYYRTISNKNFELAIVGRRVSFTPDIGYFFR